MQQLGRDLSVLQDQLPSRSGNCVLVLVKPFGTRTGGEARNERDGSLSSCRTPKLRPVKQASSGDHDYAAVFREWGFLGCSRRARMIWLVFFCCRLGGLEVRTHWWIFEGW